MTSNGALTDLENYLRYLKEEGEETIEVSPDIVQQLDKIPEGTSQSTTKGSNSDSMKKSSGSAQQALDKMSKKIAACKKCSLHETRTNVVPGQGSPNPEIMFIGEAPGADEDKQGLAFVGRAGKLLTKMIEAMGFTRDEVFIGNILKCRPPNNRPPTPEESDTCIPYLKAQIDELKPKVIIALGATSTKGLLKTEEGISKMRGKWFSFNGIDLMPTYHPAYLLRNSAGKKDVWNDLQAVLKHIGREIPKTPKK